MAMRFALGPTTRPSPLSPSTVAVVSEGKEEELVRVWAWTAVGGEISHRWSCGTSLAHDGHVWCGVDAAHLEQLKIRVQASNTVTTNSLETSQAHHGKNNSEI